MNFRSLLVLCGIALSMAACMPAAPQIDASLLNSLVITDVIVEASSVNDGDSEVEIVKASGRDPNLAESGEYLQTPAGRKRLNDRISALIRDEFMRVASQRLKGAVKARLVVKVEFFDIPSAMRKIIVGGNPMGSFTATLVDASTGRLLVTSPPLAGVLSAEQGLLGAAVESVVTASARPANARTAEAMANTYFNWLLQPR